MDVSSGRNGSGRLYEYVIEKIKEMIFSGELRQGEKIPSERELSARFSVSRIPIREALKILEYMGIVDSTQGDGTYLRNLMTEDMASKMGFAITTTADTIMNLQELRVNLETFAAYTAALRRTDEDIADIRQSLQDMRDAKKEPNMDQSSVENLRQLSYNFHRLLVRAAHNNVLTSIYENLYELLDISRQFTISTSGISYNSILAHEAVFHKIIQQDPDGARSSMAEHLSDVRFKLSTILAEAEALELLSNIPSDSPD